MLHHLTNKKQYHQPVLRLLTPPIPSSSSHSDSPIIDKFSPAALSLRLRPSSYRQLVIQKASSRPLFSSNGSRGGINKQPIVADGGISNTKISGENIYDNGSGESRDKFHLALLRFRGKGSGDSHVARYREDVAKSLAEAAAASAAAAASLAAGSLEEVEAEEGEVEEEDEGDGIGRDIEDEENYDKDTNPAARTDGGQAMVDLGRKSGGGVVESLKKFFTPSFASSPSSDASSSPSRPLQRAISAHRTFSFASELQPSTREGPVVLALDLTSRSAEALTWTVKTLVLPGDSLHLVHVVCDPRADPDLPLAATRSRLVPDLNEEARRKKLLEDAKERMLDLTSEALEGLPTGVRFSASLPVLRSPRNAAGIARHVLACVDRLAPRILVIASNGPGALAAYGSVSRYCYLHSRAPLLLVPPRAPETGPTVPVGASNAKQEFSASPSPQSEEDEESSVYYYRLAGGAPTNSLIGDDKRDASSFTNSDIRSINTQKDTNTQVPYSNYDADDRPIMPPSSPTVASPSLIKDASSSSSSTSFSSPSPSTLPTAAKGVIMLVVSDLDELAAHWEWVVDNLYGRGSEDAVHIYHVTGSTGEGGEEGGGEEMGRWRGEWTEERGEKERGGRRRRRRRRRAETYRMTRGNLPALPTAILTQMRIRGVKDVSYRHLYSEYGKPEDVGAQVVRISSNPSKGDPEVKIVALISYGRRGLLQEALYGSVADFLTRHCRKPLLLLQPPEDWVKESLDPKVVEEGMQ